MAANKNITKVSAESITAQLVEALGTQDLDTAVSIFTSVKALKEEASVLAKKFDEFRKVMEDTNSWGAFLSATEKINKQGRQAAEMTVEARLAKLLNK